MKTNINIKNIVVLTLILISFSGLVFLDYQWFEKEFNNFKTQLNNIRYDSLFKNKVLVVKFKGKQMSVTDYRTKETLNQLKVPTLKKVMYDTTIGKDTIVFDKGTTNRFNVRIHGGEIILKSRLGFKRHLHINCAGYIREGRYPEE